jgi:hypothetical protein
VRLNKKEEESLNGLVLEKLRQNSISVKKVRKTFGIVVCREKVIPSHELHICPIDRSFIRSILRFRSTKLV